MKKPLIPYWIYDPNDPTTWKYICIENNFNKRPKFKWVENPEFKYKHRDPLDDDFNTLRRYL